MSFIRFVVLFAIFLLLRFEDRLRAAIGYKSGNDTKGEEGK